MAWATIATPEDLRAAPGTAGRPPRGTVVRLYDEAGRPVARGETGRIFVGNELAFEGYTGGGGKDAIEGLLSSGDVGHFDADGRLHEQRARVVVLSAFVFEHVRLLLLSKTGRGPFAKGLANRSGYVGRNLMAHGDVRAMGVFDDYIVNGFIGPGSAAMRIDDFNGNNFDHAGLGFIRGGTIGPRSLRFSSAP